MHIKKKHLSGNTIAIPQGTYPHSMAKKDYIWIRIGITTTHSTFSTDNIALAINATQAVSGAYYFFGRGIDWVN